MTCVMAHEETLLRADFFADADPEALGKVAARGHERHLIRGDVLFNEGDPPSALYLVVRGRLAIAISNPIDRRESVVALMEAGDLFGEMGMFGVDEGREALVLHFADGEDADHGEPPVKTTMMITHPRARSGAGASRATPAAARPPPGRCPRSRSRRRRGRWRGR